MQEDQEVRLAIILLTQRVNDLEKLISDTAITLEKLIGVVESHAEHNRRVMDLIERRLS